MSPEQIRGDDVDARSDIYSFGALMFELLTGQHLFTGSTAVGVLTKHLTTEPDAPSMRAPKMGIDPRVDHALSQGAREGSGAALADRGRARRRRSKRSTPRPSSTRRARAASSQRSVRAPLSRHGRRARRKRPAPAPLRHRRVRARSQAPRDTCSLAADCRVLVLAGTGAAAWYAMREPPPLTAESEPNNDRSAREQDRGRQQVTGFHRQAHVAAGWRSRHLRRAVAGGQPAHRHACASPGLPNLDINLAITDGDGLHGATSDEGRSRRRRGSAPPLDRRPARHHRRRDRAEGASCRSRTSATRTR